MATGDTPSLVRAESPLKADKMPGRHSNQALPCAEKSAIFYSQRNTLNNQVRIEEHENLPTGERNANSAAPFNLAAILSSSNGAYQTQRNWADCDEDLNPEVDDSFTVVKGRKRRRDSPVLPAMAAQSNNAGASRRHRPSTGRMPQVQEIRTTRAHVMEARARQASCTEEQCCYLECCPEYQTYQYMKAMEKVVGGTRNIVQFTKVNGQYLVGLANRSLAERLVREGLEIEGTLLKTFPFRRTSIRITIGNLPFFVGDAAVMDALSRYGRITSIAPKQLRVGEFDFTDGRREAFILLHDGITVEMLPARFEIKIKGEPWPAFLTYGIKRSKCRGQGHRRANCPQLHGRPTTSRRASPPPSTSLPPSTAPGLPRRTSAAPPAPAPPSPAMEVCSAPPVSRAVLHLSAPRPSSLAAPALPMEETPSAPPPVTPAPSLQAPEVPVGPRPAKSQHPEPTPPARPDFVAPRDPLPTQETLGPAAPTPDVEMSIVEETTASSTSAAKNATRVDLDEFIEWHPTVSFAGTDALGLGREEVLDLLSSRTKAQRNGPLLSPPHCDALAGLISQILDLKPGITSNLYKVLGQVRAELTKTPAAVPTPPLPAPRPAGPTPSAPHREESTPAMTPPSPLPAPMEEDLPPYPEDLIFKNYREVLSSQPDLKALVESEISWTDVINAILHSQSRAPFLARLSPDFKKLYAVFFEAVFERARDCHPRILSGLSELIKALTPKTRRIPSSASPGSSGSAGQEPGRPSIPSPTGVKISSKNGNEKIISKENSENRVYANPPTGVRNANLAAARGDVTTGSAAATSSNGAARVLGSWADSIEDQGHGEDDDFTVVKNKKRRRESPGSPAAAAPSSGTRGAGATRRPRSSTGWAPRAEEIRTTRAHIVEARARQASSTEDHCVYVERSPELEPFHYMRAIERMFGETREVFQLTKMNGHFLVGLANRGMAERLVNEGLEVEGTLHRAFPFRKRAERITVGNLPFFVGDAAVISALSSFGRVTSLAPKLMKAGPYIYNDGRREAFIILREGMTIERLPTRLDITIKGEAWPAYLSSGIRCSRCRGQGHRRANCPLLARRTTAPGPATPTSPTSVPPATAPRLPQQPSAQPPPPASPSPTMEVSDVPPTSRAALHPPEALRQSPPAPSALHAEDAPPAPPPVTPAPSLRTPGSREPAAPTPDVEMSIVEETFASSTSSAKNATRVDLDAFIEGLPSVSFAKTDALGLGREEVLDLLSSRTKAQRKGPLLSPPQCDALVGLIGQILDLKPGHTSNLYKVLGQVRAELTKTPAAAPTPPLPAPRPDGPIPPPPNGDTTTPDVATPPPPPSAQMEVDPIDKRCKELQLLTFELMKEFNPKPLPQFYSFELDLVEAVLYPEDREGFLGRFSPGDKKVLAQILDKLSTRDLDFLTLRGLSELRAALPCRGQGHRRANCPMLAGRTTAPGPAAPTSPTSVPPATAPRLPQQPSARPPPPASPISTMEVSDVPPASRAAPPPPAALQPSPPAPSALPLGDTPPAPPPVTPAPSLRTPGSREPAAPTPDVEMSIVEETFASSTSSAKNATRVDLDAFIEALPSVSFAKTDALGLGREEVLDLLSSRTKAQRKGPLLSPPQCDALVGLIGQILDLKPGHTSNLYKVLGQVRAELTKTPAAAPTPPLPAPRPDGPIPPPPHGNTTTPDMATPPPPPSAQMEVDPIDKRCKELQLLTFELMKEFNPKPLPQLYSFEHDLVEATACTVSTPHVYTRPCGHASRELLSFFASGGRKVSRMATNMVWAESPSKAEDKPVRLGSKAQPSAEITAKDVLQNKNPIVLTKNQNYVNPSAGSQDANSAAPVDLAAIPTSDAAAQVRRNWADITEEVNPGAEEGFTLVQGRKRRRGSANSPTAAAPSSNPGGSRTIRRPQPSAGSVPRAQEIRVTRAHIAEARARQASSSEEHCVYIEHSPELEPFHYLRALDRMLGGTAGVIQITKVNGHQLLGLTNRGLAERLISEGLEVEGTLLRAFPFRKRAERITVGNLPFFVADSAVITALSPYGPVTSIAPKQMKAGPYVYVDGRRDVFITLHEGITIERLPTRLDINIKGQAWPAYLSSGIRCSRCHGQGHRRAICPLLAGLANNTRTAPPTTPAGVPPPTTPAPPQRSAAQPPAPTPSNPAMEVCSAPPVARAALHSSAPRPSPPAAPAFPMEETPPAPPPVTPAPSLQTPGSREPAAPTPDVEMSIVEETFASSTSSAKNATRVDLDAFIEGLPSVSFAKTDALGLGREEVLDLLSSRTRAQRKGPLLSPPQCDALVGLIGQILDLKPGHTSNLYKVLGQVKAELRTTPAVPPTPTLPAPWPSKPTPPALHGEKTSPDIATPPPPLSTEFIDACYDQANDIIYELSDERYSETLSDIGVTEGDIVEAIIFPDDREPLLRRLSTQKRTTLAGIVSAASERARSSDPFVREGLRIFSEMLPPPPPNLWIVKPDYQDRCVIIRYIPPHPAMFDTGVSGCPDFHSQTAPPGGVYNNGLEERWWSSNRDSGLKPKYSAAVLNYDIIAPMTPILAQVRLHQYKEGGSVVPTTTTMYNTDTKKKAVLCPQQQQCTTQVQRRRQFCPNNVQHRYKEGGSVVPTTTTMYNIDTKKEAVLSQQCTTMYNIDTKKEAVLSQQQQQCTTQVQRRRQCCPNNVQHRYKEGGSVVPTTTTMYNIDTKKEAVLYPQQQQCTTQIQRRRQCCPNNNNVQHRYKEGGSFVPTMYNIDTKKEAVLSQQQQCTTQVQRRRQCCPNNVQHRYKEGGSVVPTTTTMYNIDTKKEAVLYPQQQQCTTQVQRRRQCCPNNVQHRYKEGSSVVPTTTTMYNTGTKKEAVLYPQQQQCTTQVQRRRQCCPNNVQHKYKEGGIVVPTTTTMYNTDTKKEAVLSQQCTTQIQRRRQCCTHNNNNVQHRYKEGSSVVPTMYNIDTKKEAVLYPQQQQCTTQIQRRRQFCPNNVQHRYKEGGSVVPTTTTMYNTGTKKEAVLSQQCTTQIQRKRQCCPNNNNVQHRYKEGGSVVPTMYNIDTKKEAVLSQQQQQCTTQVQRRRQCCTHNNNNVQHRYKEGGSVVPTMYNIDIKKEAVLYPQQQQCTTQVQRRRQCCTHNNNNVQHRYKEGGSVVPTTTTMYNT
ncbi:hypothetical protein LAZ67_12000303, partial [Cordylochernes scorpioides]